MPTAVLVDYIDAHRDRFGVEPICEVLSSGGTKIAPSTYYAAKTRPASARAIRDAELVPVMNRSFRGPWMPVETAGGPASSQVSSM
ncbi:hypothetical protein HEB94_000520 [Actinopolymorpha pittospori]|uniref:Transposase n=1 Tax=Actinopolymorpha pittospori TaxID=648752 RepID=A0A927MUR6_9ACTN|nr:hypothetical protein [Actinopolymorpha pittospori]